MPLWDFACCVSSCTASLPAAKLHKHRRKDSHVPCVLRRKHRGQPQTRAGNQVRELWHIKNVFCNMEPSSLIVINTCQQCHLAIALKLYKFLISSPSRFQVQLWGQVRLWQALPGPGVLRPRSHGNLLQRDRCGGAQLHMEELQVPGVPGATAETHQLPEHHHHLPKARKEHVPHDAQLQRHRLPPLVRLHGAAGVEWGH